MTVKNCLRNCLLLYPSIFNNKWDVYHHWFIVNGNGYEWENGQLISMDEERKVSMEDAVKKHFDFLASDENLLSSPRYYIDSLKKSIIDSLNVEKRTNDFSTSEINIYPLCEYAKILNIPSDIKPDWLEAVREFRDWMISNKDKLSDNDKYYLKDIKKI